MSKTPRRTKARKSPSKKRVKRTPRPSAALLKRAERTRSKHPLRIARAKRKMTREQLAKKAKVSIACLRDVECRGAVPRPPTMQRIAKVLRVNALDLHRAVFEAMLAQAA